MKTALRSLLVLIAIMAAGCPAPKDGKGPKGGGSSIDPDACGDISGKDVGRKAYAFLQASAALDKASTDLEVSMRAACRKMAHELGVSTEGEKRCPSCGMGNLWTDRNCISCKARLPG